MNELGPLKSILPKNVENMRNGRMRIRNLVTNTNVAMAANTATTAATAATETKKDTRTDNVWEYQYIPPAAKRFYLWDSTQTGVSYVSYTRNDVLEVQINFIALSSVLTVLERHGFKEPGFLLGTKGTKIVFDRFDMGRNNAPTMVLKGDEVMKIHFKSSDYYRNLVLELEKYVTSNSAILYYPWIVNIQVKEEELEIFSARILPKVSLKCFGIPSIRIVPSALVMDLSQDTEIRYGFMAIDQARHVVFLKDEVKSMDFCLVGIWVSGIHDIKDDFIRQLSVYYLMNRVLSKLGTSFIICLYSQDPRFYQLNYEMNQDDFWLQKAELHVSVSNSDQNIFMEFEDVDIGRDEEFCKVYKEIRGVDLFQEPVVEQIQPTVDVEDLEIEQEVETEPEKDIDIELKNQDLPEKEVTTRPAQTNEDKKDDFSSEKEFSNEKELQLNVEQVPNIRISTKPDDSHNQQWVYLTLLQQQIDILRTQMMHLINKEHTSNTISVSTNTPALSFQEYGTNTSFKVDSPEKKDQAVQVLILEPVEVAEKVEALLDTPDPEDLNIDSGLKPPFDTGSNYKPFFSVSKVEENPNEEIKDSPETTFSKSMIAQLAQNPNSSFIYESETQGRNKEVSQELPDESSLNTTLLSPGHSFATQEYLRRHGLLNDSVISTLPTTAQNSSVFLKPPRSSSEFKVLDSMRLKSLGKLL